MTSEEGSRFSVIQILRSVDRTPDDASSPDPTESAVPPDCPSTSGTTVKETQSHHKTIFSDTLYIAHAGECYMYGSL